MKMQSSGNRRTSFPKFCNGDQCSDMMRETLRVILLYETLHSLSVPKAHSPLELDWNIGISRVLIILVDVVSHSDGVLEVAVS